MGRRRGGDQMEGSTLTKKSHSRSSSPPARQLGNDGEKGDTWVFKLEDRWAGAEMAGGLAPLDNGRPDVGRWWGGALVPHLM
jgi:hypothetical protein